MFIPIFVQQKFVDKNGFLTPEVQLYHDVMNVQMQQHLSDDGMVMPSRNTADINYIALDTTNNAKPNGTVWYDDQDNVLKAKINGTVKTITAV